MFNLTGSIDEAAYNSLSEYLEAAKGKNVHIRINSGGGSHIDSLAMYSLLRAYPGEVTITVLGSCYSAAVLIFAAGDVRVAAKESWFMVHQDSGELAGSTSEMQAEVACLARKEVQWAELMSKRTGAEVYEWDELSKATTYLSAEEMKELGLVHKYLKEKA